MELYLSTFTASFSLISVGHGENIYGRKAYKQVLILNKSVQDEDKNEHQMMVTNIVNQFGMWFIVQNEDIKFYTIQSMKCFLLFFLKSI